MEEEITKNVEFPTEGKFTVQFGRYKVCGDAILGECRSQQSKTWSIPKPWTNSPGPSGLSTRSRRGDVSSQPYETFLKRSIPFVSLSLDRTNRNIIVDSTINNVYIKIPDSTVSVQAILSAIATKIGSCEANELIILDVKFIEISDDKGQSN